MPRALYWDTEDPYHYIRLEDLNGNGKAGGAGSGYELLIVGGEDHRTGQADDTEERYAHLQAWARERFPMMEEIEDNVFVVTGDSGQGMTHGTIAGILLTDLILGRENSWTTLQVKLDELIRATVGAHQSLLDLEELEEEDLALIRRQYRQLAAAAREDLRRGLTDTDVPPVEPVT